MQNTVYALTSRLILPEKPMRIKLLGDSITHGVGGTGFQQNGDPITAGFARNPDGYCFANLFRDHMEKVYGCQVINNACTGTTIEFILQHFDELVDASDDLVICTIGTNNRHQYFTAGPRHTRREHMEAFYRNILQLHEAFRVKGVDVIFNANIPASPSNEQDGPDYWRLFHMSDVHDLYRKASSVCGFPMIDFYTAFLEYCSVRSLSADALLADGCIPTTKDTESCSICCCGNWVLPSLRNDFPITI